MEQLRRRGPPGGNEGQQLFAFFRIEPDHVLDHQHSPLWCPHHKENRTPRTCQVSSVEALVVAHQLITGHGDRIDIASQVTQGTTETLTLPLTEGAQDA
jgi:hypothetical protein